MNPDLLRKIGGAVVATVGTLIIGSVLTSKYKDRAYKELQEKHGIEMGKKLSEEFNKRIDAITAKKPSKQEFKKNVAGLCQEFGIASVVA